MNKSYKNIFSANYGFNAWSMVNFLDFSIPTLLFVISLTLSFLTIFASFHLLHPSDGLPISILSAIPVAISIKMVKNHLEKSWLLLNIEPGKKLIFFNKDKKIEKVIENKSHKKKIIINKFLKNVFFYNNEEEERLFLELKTSDNSSLSFNINIKSNVSDFALYVKNNENYNEDIDLKIKSGLFLILQNKTIGENDLKIWVPQVKALIANVYKEYGLDASSIIIDDIKSITKPDLKCINDNDTSEAEQIDCSQSLANKNNKKVFSSSLAGHP